MKFSIEEEKLGKGKVFFIYIFSVLILNSVSTYPKNPLGGGGDRER